MAGVTTIPSEESKKLADKLIEEATRDGVLNNVSVMKARVAQVIEESWQQGLDDAKTFDRVMSIIGKK